MLAITNCCMLHVFISNNSKHSGRENSIVVSVLGVGMVKIGLWVMKVKYCLEWKVVTGDFDMSGPVLME